MTVVRVSRPNTSACIGMMVAGMLVTGCTPTKKPLLPQPPATQQADRWGTAAALRRVKNLSREADNLAVDAQQLPGQNTAEYTRLMQRIFTDLLQTLTLMGDPLDDRVLAQRLTSIQTARARLVSGSAALSIEPTIDTALRAAVAALGDLSHSDLFEQANVNDDLDSLSALLGRLDLSERQESLHRVDVAETVRLISKVATNLSATLSARIAVEQPGTSTAPTTQPPVPATQPTAPPALPATEPAAPPTQPAVPATQPAAPATPPTIPAIDSTAPSSVPATQPAAPTTQPAVPATQPAAPATESAPPPTKPATPDVSK